MQSTKEISEFGFVASGQKPNDNNFRQVGVADPLLDNIQISLQLVGDPKFEGRGKRLANCGTKFNVLLCGCNFHKALIRCNYRICPYCGKIRSFTFYKKFIQILGGMKIARSIYDTGLRFLTLTLKNKESLEYCIDELYASFNRMRRRNYFKERVFGGIGVIEIKRGKDGLWNGHMHYIIYSKYLDVKSHKKTGEDSKLVKEWKLATRGSGVLDIRRITSSRGALNYILKYITKGIVDLNNNEKATFFKLTFGRRLLFTFGKKGLFYNVKTIKVKALCKNCNCPFKFVHAGSPEFELFLKWDESKDLKPPKDIDYWI